MRHFVKTFRTPRLCILGPSCNLNHSSFGEGHYCSNVDEVTPKDLAHSPAASPYTSLMLSSMFIQWTTAILAAVMGGFGVFCAVQSSASPEVAVKSIILLGCACALSYFSQRQ